MTLEIERTPDDESTAVKTTAKLTADCTDLLLTMNRQDTVIAQTHHLCAGNILQIDGMGVNFDRFYPADQHRRAICRRNFGIPEDAFVLVYAAEFSGRKNQASLIRAFAKLPQQAWLLLAGRGGELESCRDLAKELGVAERVVFAGFIPDVESCYHAADLCMSTSRSEGLPFNLMEAMHCGLPVVATRVKGHEDLVLDGVNGFLVPFGDEDALLHAVVQIMEQPELCRAFGIAGKERVERYALEYVLDANMQIMNDFFQSRHLIRNQETEKIS